MSLAMRGGQANHVRLRANVDARVGGATLLSRLLGFLRDVVIAAVLGAGALADAFFVAVQIPNLFRRLLAEGALNAAFVPLWLRRRQEDGERAARRFSEDVLGTLGAALAAIAVLCALFAPALVQLLAPGFRGASRISMPSTSCGSPRPISPSSVWSR